MVFDRRRTRVPFGLPTLPLAGPVRASIHAGRKEDRLLFDHQRSVAALLGFDSPHGNDAIEACSVTTARFER